MQCPSLLRTIMAFYCLGAFANAILADDQVSSSASNVRCPSQASESKTVSYAVADLIIPYDTKSFPNSFSNLTLQARFPKLQEISEPYQEQLIKLIVRSVEPGSWETAGGKGTIRYDEAKLSVEVRQTESVHAQISKLLGDLRKLQGTEVSLATCEVEVDVQTAERFLTLGNFTEQRFVGSKVPVQAAMLNQKQFRGWLGFMQESRNTSTTQSPKITVFNAQPCYLVSGDEEEDTNGGRSFFGHVSTFLPIVAADSRSVRLHSEFHSLSKSKASVLAPVPDGDPHASGFVFHGQLYAPVAVTQDNCSAGVVDIPDGKTMVFSLGTRQVDVCRKTGPALLRDLPLVGEFFTETENAVEKRHVFLFVTAKVLEAEQGDESAGEVGFAGITVINGRARSAPTREPSDRVIKTYSVADLVLTAGASTEEYEDNLEKLKAAIREKVDPTSWSHSGGRGSMQYYGIGMALVVTQTPENQERIAEYLESLRKN